jgi:hypothetical protein
MLWLQTPTMMQNNNVGGMRSNPKSTLTPHFIKEILTNCGSYWSNF